jgi:hypothetical protein
LSSITPAGTLSLAFAGEDDCTTAVDPDSDVDLGSAKGDPGSLVRDPGFNSSICMQGSGVPVAADDSTDSGARRPRRRAMSSSSLGS